MDSNYAGLGGMLDMCQNWYPRMHSHARAWERGVMDIFGNDRMWILEVTI